MRYINANNSQYFCGPFIWRFQSPHHRRALLFYYFNINCASSGALDHYLPCYQGWQRLWRERVAGGQGQGGATAASWGELPSLHQPGLR